MCSEQYTESSHVHALQYLALATIACRSVVWAQAVVVRGTGPTGGAQLLQGGSRTSAVRPAPTSRPQPLGMHHILEHRTGTGHRLGQHPLLRQASPGPLSKRLFSLQAGRLSFFDPRARTRQIPASEHLWVSAGHWQLEVQGLFTSHTACKNKVACSIKVNDWRSVHCRPSAWPCMLGVASRSLQQNAWASPGKCHWSMSAWCWGRRSCCRTS